MDKQILFIDIDNVILPLIEEVSRRYNETYHDNLSIENFKEYDVKKFIKPECKSLFKEFCTPDLFELVVPYDGAVEYVTELNRLYRVFFLSSGHPNTMEHRDKWLDRYFKFYSSSQLIMSRKKQLLCGDLLIDDFVDNLVGGQYAKIIYTMPWNKNIDEKQIQTNRVFGWNRETLDIIDEVMEIKKKEGIKI